MRVAAVQLEAEVANVDANLSACERLADEAGARGAELICLPEFFTTGIGFIPELADCALPADGEAADLLLALARRHGARVGGSFLARDDDGHVRNAYLLATPGGLAGRHDKDLPTMWENSFYVGGADDGVIESGELTIGAAVCWELMRTQTVHRLRGQIDLAMTGSGWWSIPEYPPRSVTRRQELRNERLARKAVASFGQYVGAPVVHAAHAGVLHCKWPAAPFAAYHGHMEGATMITDGYGTVLGERHWREGEGVVMAEVEPGRVPPSLVPPGRFWLHRRGAIAAFAWWYQRHHGRRWYARHVAQSRATAGSSV